MDFQSPVSVDRLNALLVGIDKPARYVGGELNSVVREHAVRCRMALCFADIYEVAESHIGLKVLYQLFHGTVIGG